MKKRDLERAQQAFRGNTQLSTDSLRSKVSSDLNIVKDAYDVGSIALTELTKLFHSGDLDPKDVANLARAYSDIAKTLVALRDEGRATIREAAQFLQGSADADPLGPAGDEGGEAVHTQSPKISPARAKRPKIDPAKETIGAYLHAHTQEPEDDK